MGELSWTLEVVLEELIIVCEISKVIGDVAKHCNDCSTIITSTCMTQPQPINFHLLPPLRFPFLFQQPHRTFPAPNIMPDTPPTNIPQPSKTTTTTTPPRIPTLCNDPSIQDLEQQAWALMKRIDYAKTYGEDTSRYKKDLRKVKWKIWGKEREITRAEQGIWRREKEIWEREREREKGGEVSKGKDGTGKRWWWK